MKKFRIFIHIESGDGETVPFSIDIIAKDENQALIAFHELNPQSECEFSRDIEEVTE